MLRRAKTLRRLGITIFTALSNLGSAMVLYSAFIYVTAVLMMQFQAGKLSKCSDPSVYLQTYCVGTDSWGDLRRWTASTYNGGLKMAYTRTHARIHTVHLILFVPVRVRSNLFSSLHTSHTHKCQSVDWLGPALLTAFSVSSGNGWGESMSPALNAAEVGHGPVYRKTPGSFALYLLVVLAGKFVFANLFLGVLAQVTEKEVMDKIGLPAVELELLLLHLYAQES
jgi:hypothetical protein